MRLAADLPQIRTVTGACSSGQARNITLAGQLQEVQRSLLALLPRLPPPASDALACVISYCFIKLHTLPVIRLNEQRMSPPEVMGCVGFCRPYWPRS